MTATCASPPTIGDVTTPSPIATDAGRPRHTAPTHAGRGTRTGARARRTLRRLALALAIAAVVLAVAGLPVYVFPPQGDPTDADLVYVIGPPRPERLALATALRDTDGRAPLLVSVSQSRQGRGDPVFDAAHLDICRQHGVSCRSPEPFTTAGEAKMLTAYAAKREVGKTVVITFTPHVARTRYIFAKCSANDVTVVGVDTDMTVFDWVFQYAYQTAGFVKAWLTPCP